MSPTAQIVPTIMPVTMPVVLQRFQYSVSSTHGKFALAATRFCPWFGATAVGRFQSSDQLREVRERPGSDIDFLVEFEASSSLFDLLHVKDDLEALLGSPVDVVSTGALKDRDQDIRSEAIPL